MPSQFVLRNEGDAANPNIPRLYGKGLTSGLNVLYQSLGTTDPRTVFLVLLAQGARFRGDLGCSKAIKVWYAGFELAEFDSTGARQWKFHKGTVAAAPQYKAITAINTTTNVVTSTAHGYNSGDFFAFHKRGSDVSVPTSTGELPTHYKFMVWKVDNDNFKILNQLSGAAVEANAIDLTGTPLNIDRLFVYKADALYFDPIQGRPEFFPDLNFTFSGYSYLEVYLPAYLSDGENEPSNLKVMMEGKEMYVITSTAGNVAFTGTVSAEPNNANVAADCLVNDGKMPLSRLHGDTFLAWKNRADGTIPWIGGNDVPAPRASFPTLSNASYDATTATVTHSGGAGFGYAFTEQLVNPTYPSIECKFTGWSFAIMFSQNNSPLHITNQQGLEVDQVARYLYFVSNSTKKILVEDVAIGDRFKIAYENGLLKIYRNSIPMPLASTDQIQLYTTFYQKVQVLDNGGNVTDVFIAPSGTSGVPRQVKRYTGAFSVNQPTPVADIFESLIHLSPGCSWAEIDGQIRIATEPDRTPCFTFRYDPNDTEKSNVSRITIKPRSAEKVPNYWPYTFRDADDPILARKPVAIDRKLRRAALGGRLISAGLTPYGVMTQSLCERLGETRARLEADLDKEFTVEGFADSAHVVKGSIGYIVDAGLGYTEASPALVMVMDVAIDHSKVETMAFKCQLITPDFYSDTAHGAVTPIATGSTAKGFTPPEYAVDLTLTETSEPMVNGTYLASISGTVLFGLSPNQHARIFQKPLVTLLSGAAYNSGSNTFTLPDGFAVPDGSTPVSLGTATGALPTGYSLDIPYYPVNISGQTFKLATSIGGTAVAFTSNGSGLNLYSYVPWQDTLIDVYPNVDNQGVFEIIPARKSVTYVRAETRSAADISLAFSQATTEVINVTGDLTPPAPPNGLQYRYDGVNLTLHWKASPTLGVTGYIIKDEVDRFVAQTGTQNLTYVQTAQADSVTRRIYAVSSSGVLSSGYAEVTFIKPVPATWTNLVGVTLAANNLTLTKTASTAWDNAGAILNADPFLETSPFELEVSPSTNTVRHAIGLSYSSTVNGKSDIAYGFLFNENGTVSKIVAGVETAMGTYSAGQKFWITSIPQPNTPSNAEAEIHLYREVFVNGAPSRQLDSLTTADPDAATPMYVGVALYTNGTSVDSRPVLSVHYVNLDDSIPAAAQNISNATYNGTTGAIGYTGSSSSFGSSGLSIAEIPANQDGGFSFKFGSLTEQESTAVGISVTDPNTNITSMLYNIRLDLVMNVAYLYYGDAVVLDIIAFLIGGNNGEEYSITREGSWIVVRVDGAIQFIDRNPVVGAQPLILDVAMKNGSGGLYDVKKWLPVDSTQGSSFASYTTETQLTALVGKNRADDIPKFVVEAPQENEVATFDAEGQLVNLPVGANGMLACLARQTINLNNSAAQTIYTVPAGYKCVPVFAIVRDATEELGATWPDDELKFGLNGTESYTPRYPAGVGDIGKWKTVYFTNEAPFLEEADDFTAQVTAVIGHTATVDVDLFGYLLPVTPFTWTPADLTQAIARYKWSEMVGFADNDPVGTFVDSIGAFDATSSGSNRPTYKSAGYVSFDGTDDLLDTGITNTFGDFAVFLVFRAFNLTESTSRIVDKHYANGFWIGTDFTGDGDLGGGVQQGSSPYGDYYAASANTWYAMLFQRSGTTKTIRFAGNSNTATVSSSAMGSEQIRLGAETGTGSTYGQFDLKEMVVCNDDIVGDGLTNLVAYALAEYGLTL